MLPFHKAVRIAWFGFVWAAFHYTLYWRLTNETDTAEYSNVLTGLNIMICVQLDVILLGICAAIIVVAWTGEPLSTPTQIQQQRLRSGTVG